MSAVELADWQQIQGRREDADPGGPCHRMKVDRLRSNAGEEDVGTSGHPRRGIPDQLSIEPIAEYVDFSGFRRFSASDASHSLRTSRTVLHFFQSELQAFRRLGGRNDRYYRTGSLAFSI